MPINPIPIFVSLALFVVPAVCFFNSRKSGLIAVAASFIFVCGVVLRVYVPGWYLAIGAYRNDPSAQYELARWEENHGELLNDFIVWPLIPNVEGGYAWLERSASLNYPPALYALGVRFKYGIHVPPAPDWDGSPGNLFRQPKRGQPLIDKALRLGFQPMVPEKQFYISVFRKRP